MPSHYEGWTWGFEWVDLPLGQQGFPSSIDREGAKEYADQTGLPVREFDARGFVSKEYWPALEMS